MSMADEARLRNGTDTDSADEYVPERMAVPPGFRHSGLIVRPARNTEKYVAQRYSEPPTEKKKDISNTVIIGIASAVLTVCVVILAVYVYQIIEAKQTHDDLLEIYRNSQHSAETQVILPEADIEPALPDIANEPVSDEPAADYTDERQPLTLLPAAAELLAINSDTAGYISIPGVLDEAVVQTDNNEYYLTHNFYGDQRQCGTVFADYRCIINDYPEKMSDNIILYGHNQRDGSMFGNLDYYRWHPEYWNTNPFIYFNTDYEESVYVIIASFVTNTDPEDDNGNIFDYWNYIRFTEKRRFEDFIGEVKLRSTFLTDIDTRATDKFITLSTCSTEWDTSRHAVVARKLREGETEEQIKESTVFTVNPNPKWPAVYYIINGRQ